MKTPRTAIVYYSGNNGEEQSEVFVAYDCTTEEAIAYLNYAHYGDFVTELGSDNDEGYGPDDIDAVYPLDTITDKDGKEFTLAIVNKEVK